MFSIEVPMPSGGRRRLRRRAKTKTEALRLMRATQADIDRYGGVPDANRLVGATVGDYLEMRQGLALQPLTYVQDDWAARLVTQGLGTRRLGSVTVADCDAFLKAAADGTYSQPLGQAQMRRLRQKLIQIIGNDQRRGIVARNVAELSVMPEESPAVRGRRKPRALQVVELNRLIDAAHGVTRVVIDLSGRNGLRPAEVRGLRWSRVDLDAMTVRVDGQMNRRNEVVRAKTKRSHRTNRIDDTSVQRLRDWPEEQRAQEAKAGPAWSANPDRLLITPLVGTAINQRNVHRSIVLACDRAEITPRISAYDLRHTAITLQVENGHQAHRIADWAGTSERMIADVYRHKLSEIMDLGPIEG